MKKIIGALSLFTSLSVLSIQTPDAFANSAQMTPTPGDHDPKAQYNTDRDQSDGRVYGNDVQRNGSRTGATKPANADTDYGTEQGRMGTGADSGTTMGGVLNSPKSDTKP